MSERWLPSEWTSTNEWMDGWSNGVKTINLLAVDLGDVSTNDHRLCWPEHFVACV